MRDNDILFFNLHRRYLNASPQFGGFLGIFTLASFLNENGYRAQSYAGQLTEGLRLIDEACQNHNIKMIGLYCDYENVTEVIFLSSYIKETYQIPVIVGGPQSTSLKKDFYIKSQCDAVVRYEGEITVLDLANYYIESLGVIDDIKGISYLKDNDVITHEEQDLIENLDALPFINDECYLVPKQDYTELSIMTGRGCPFHCSFCHEGHHTRKVRFRSVENVIEEIKTYIETHEYIKNLHILFTDDTFTLIPERVKKLCEGLEQLQKIKPFRWFCEGHVHTLFMNLEMINYIAKAGAQRIQLGIEAGTQEVLDAYKKGSTLEEIKTVVKHCYDSGIEEVYSNIILAGAHFTRDVYIKNIDFAKELLKIAPGVMEIGVVSYWPLPETTITNHPEDYGLNILDYDFITSSGDFPQIETKDIDRWELIEMMKSMEYELSEYMKELLIKGFVKTELINSWLSRKHTKYIGRWIYALNQLPHMLNFYSMVFSGECNFIDTISKDFLHIHPMRTVQLSKYLKNDSGNKSLFGYKLNDLEVDILIYSLGKLSVDELILKLREKYDDITLINTENIENVLRKLSSQYLLVYSKY
jgi:putative radical SAM domain protein